MDNRISLDAMIHLAVIELNDRNYEEYLEEKKRNKLPGSDEQRRKNISKIIAKENRKESQRVMAKRLYKAAVCFALIFSCMSGAFLTAEAVRESVVTVAIEWYEKFTRTTITAENTPTELPEIELGYIPEGFEIDDSSFNINGFYYRKLLHTEGYIEITAMLSMDDGNFNLDNERMDYYTIILGEERGIWISNDKYTKLLISYNGVAFDLYGTVSISELIKIYENIKIL